MSKRQIYISIFILSAIYILILVIYNGVKTTFFPPATQTPYPTYTPYPTPTEERYGMSNFQTQVAERNQPEGCINWSEVTPLMIGKDICVFGIVHRNTPVSGTTSQIRFTDDENKFFLASGTVYYPDVGKGDCVMAQGTVLQNTYHVPYIDIDNGLKNCNFE